MVCVCGKGRREKGRKEGSHEVCEVFTLRLKMWFSQILVKISR